MMVAASAVLKERDAGAFASFLWTDAANYGAGFSKRLEAGLGRLTVFCFPVRCLVDFPLQNSCTSRSERVGSNIVVIASNS